MSDIGRWTTPVARKQHTCENCYRKIDQGEKYHRYDGIYDGRASSWKTCHHCSALVRVFGLFDIYDEGVGPDEIGEWEPDTVAGLRAKVYWRKRWTRSDGTLYPIPSVTPEPLP